MQTPIILSHENLATTRQAFYAQRAALQALEQSPNMSPTAAVTIMTILDLLNQICDQLDAAHLLRASTDSTNEPHIPAAQLARVAKLLTGKVLVNNKTNITIGVKGDDLVITQP